MADASTVEKMKEIYGTMDVGLTTENPGYIKIQ